MKEHHHWNEVFIQEMQKESDRAIVILSASFLEKALTDCLKRHFVSIPDDHDDLFDDDNSPLSDFNSKIRIAYRLGIVSKKFCRDLRVIRKMRNDCAHNIQSYSFGDATVLSRVFDLNRSSGLISRFPSKRKEFPDGTKGDFIMNVSWMLWHLNQEAGEKKNLPEAEEEWGYFDISEPELQKEKKEISKK